MGTIVRINRAPVMTLWAAVVMERLGYKRDEALTLGRAVAGLNANAKAQIIGLRERAKPGKSAKEAQSAKRPPAAKHVLVLGREVPIVKTAEGVRAAKDGKPDSPEAVKRYLESKFGESLAATRTAMQTLAKSFTREELETHAYALYEQFRPTVPRGTAGWGAKGELDLGALVKLGASPKRR